MARVAIKIELDRAELDAVAQGFRTTAIYVTFSRLRSNRMFWLGPG